MRLGCYHPEMAEVLVSFNDTIVADGVPYRARACGREMDDGRWEGWIEFESLDARLYLNGTMAVVMAVVNIETSRKGGPVSPARLRLVHTWVYQKDRWQLAAHQSLRLPK